MPKETSEAFDAEGWLSSGDMGYLDEDGYIILMGRKKEMYIQGGFNVYPVEVENLLKQAPEGCDGSRHRGSGFRDGRGGKVLHHPETLDRMPPRKN